MSFTVDSKMIDNVARLTLTGALDSSTAIMLQEEVMKIIPQNPRELVMDVEHLDFMASAGLRIIIFAKQKLGTQAKLVLVKPQDQLIETLKMTGLIFSVVIVDKYPE
ncbi:MAG TPA: STAS domain-containing protein [Bacteroidales bacterium]|nr:STAS domain-containing protein [Bacteroidales bacterium]